MINEQGKVRAVREHAERLLNPGLSWDGRAPSVAIDRERAAQLLATAQAAEDGDAEAVAATVAVYDSWEPCPIGSSLRIPPALFEQTGHATPLPYGGPWPDRG
jgi:hypothetical protein